MFPWKFQVLLMCEQCSQVVPDYHLQDNTALAILRKCQWTRKISMIEQFYVLTAFCGALLVLVLFIGGAEAGRRGWLWSFFS